MSYRCIHDIFIAMPVTLQLMQVMQITVMQCMSVHTFTDLD